ncbi:MAG: hypothetical protein ACRDNF_01685 [Streptosporangiaceae bacterium]
MSLSRPAQSARRFARAGGPSVDPVVPAGFEWRQALGDYHRLPEWIGYFTRAIDEDGWPPPRWPTCTPSTPRCMRPPNR